MNELERCFEVGDDGRMVFNKKPADPDFGLSHDRPQQTTNKRKPNKEKNIFDDCMIAK